MSVTTLITSSSKEANQEKLIELAKIFFQNEDINFYKSSFLGSQIKMLSDIVADNALVNTLSFEERFMNTLKFKSSAFSIGSMYGYNKTGINYSKIDIGLALEITTELDEYFDIQNNSLRVDKSTKVNPMYINCRENFIFKENIKFCFPGDIEIIKRLDNSWQAILRNNKNFESRFTPVLTSNKIEIGEKQYFLFRVDIGQLEIIEDSTTISTRVNTAYYDFDLEFENNFYKINLFYNEYNEITKVTEKINIEIVDDIKLYTPNDDVCEIIMLNTNKIRITFGNGVNGKFYTTGKEINYELYTTSGETGNLVKPEFTFNTSDELNNYSFIIFANGNAEGGTNSLSLVELKSEIIKFIQTPTTMITDFDFKNKVGEYLDMKENEVFIKIRRNDPIERIIDLFLLLVDYNTYSAPYIVKTNTLNVKIEQNNIGNINNTIKPFFLIESDGISNELKSNIYAVNSTDNIYFSNFFAIKIHNSPTLIADFFDLSCNYSLDYLDSFINSKFIQEVIVNRITVSRDIFSRQKDYLFKIELRASTREFLEKNNLIIRMFVFNSEKKFYLDFSKNINNGSIEHDKYICRLSSTDEIDDSNKLLIKDVFTKVSEARENYEEWEFVSNLISLDNKVNIKIGIFYNYNTNKVVEDSDFAKLPDIKYKTLLSVIESTDIELYRNLNKIFLSKIELDNNLSTSSNPVYVLKHLPLFEKSYIDDNKNKNFLTKLNSNLTIFYKKFSLNNEVNSNLAVKFFNTWGYSDLYNGINKTNFKVSIEISYKNNSPISIDRLNIIKTNIVNYITRVNYSPLLLDKNIYISEIQSIVLEDSGVIQCRVINIDDNLYYNKKYDLNSTTIIEREDYDIFCPACIYLTVDDIEITPKFL